VVTDIRVRFYESTLGRPVGDVNFPTGNDQASAAFTFVVPLSEAERATIR